MFTGRFLLANLTFFSLVTKSLRNPFLTSFAGLRTSPGSQVGSKNVLSGLGCTQRASKYDPAKVFNCSIWIHNMYRSGLGLLYEHFENASTKIHRNDHVGLFTSLSNSNFNIKLYFQREDCQNNEKSDSLTN